MTKSKILIALVLMPLLGSCAATSKEKDSKAKGQAEKVDQLVNREKFIEDTKSRPETDAEFGPDTVDDVNRNIRDLYNVQVDMQETHDYVNIYDDGTGKVFPIDLNIENMDIRTFAQLLSNITDVNILVSDEVGGYVTAKLKDVPWPSALDSILRIKGLAKHIERDANIIRLHDQKTIVELENFERSRREELQKTVALDIASEPTYTEIFKLFYTKPATVKTILEGAISASASGGASGGASAAPSSGAGAPQITIDERMNSLIIKARKDDLDVIKKLIARVDSRTKQIFIEAFIVEVSDNFEKQLGTRLGFNMRDASRGIDNRPIVGRITGVSGTSSSDVLAGDDSASAVELPVASPMGGISFLAGIGGAEQLKLELSAMQNEGLTKVLSNPRIFTLDNQEATIFQGDEVPYETVSDSGTQIQFKEAGLKLAVTPSVVGDGNLMLALTVNKDTADTSVDNPPITKSEVKTNLVTKDGSIVVIGGIYTDTKTNDVDKVPFFGDIPFAKRLFRHEDKINNKKELMIFIAPRVL